MMEQKHSQIKKVGLLRKILGICLLLTLVAFVSGIYMLIRVNGLTKRVEELAKYNQEQKIMEEIRLEETIMPMDEYSIDDTKDSNGEVLSEKRVYLTFDDGPSIYTQQILDILEANEVKATFFVIAREEEEYWPYYQAIVDEGHVLAMHSYSHDYGKVYESLESFQADVEGISDFLYQRTGVKPTIYRFPGGSSNTATAVPIEECIAYLNEQGIVYYDWNAMNGDAVSTVLSTNELIENVMENVRKHDVSVVLMHDLASRHNTVESLQELINILKSEGYAILPIDEHTPLIQHVPYNQYFDEEAD